MPPRSASADGRIRVLRIIARMNVGGPALQVSGLMAALDSDRFDHRLLVGSVDEGEADFIALRSPGLPHVTVPGLGRSVRPGDDVLALGRLVKEIRRFRPDIVHTHTAKAGTLGRVAATVGGVPAMVHTFHGHLLHGYFSPAVTRAVIQVERTLARRTTKLVAVGAQVRDDLLAAGIGKPGQYVVVPPGIALPEPPSRDAARRALDLPSDALVAVLVARLTTIKRPERFVEAARRLTDRHPKALFVVVGEGDLLHDLKQQAGSNVRFLGWRADVETVYTASDLAVLTSDNEGMPVSLIEAALCGVPAVATDVGSVREVVLNGSTGWLCDPDTESISSAVDVALSDPGGLARAGAAAREHANVSFGRARLVADTAALYDEIIGERR